MPRKGDRERVERNIYKDEGGFEVQVCVRGNRDFEYFPLSTPITELREWRDDTAAKLRKRTPKKRRAATAGTLKADAVEFIKQIKYLASWKSIRSHLDAWVDLYGHLKRTALAGSHVRKAFSIWTDAGVKPKTQRNRRQALQQLYHTLDGEKAPTPVDDVDPPAVAKRRPVGVDRAIIGEVAGNLFAQERAGRLRDGKTRARFLVLATCGQRPASVKRALPEHVDLARRFWFVDGCKDGDAVPLYLNDDMLDAWTLFEKVNAWGPYDSRSFARCVRHAGWPPNIRPYNLRHSVGHDLADADVDLGDIQPIMGHRDLQTTRDFYSPALLKRIRKATEKLDGRFGLRGTAYGTEEFGGKKKVAVGS
jgi:integrase